MPACPRAAGGAHLEPQQQLAWPIPPGTGGPSAHSKDAAQPATARMGSGVLVAVSGQCCSGRACLLAALLRASTAPSCCLWWLLAPAAQHSEPNGQWGGQWGGQCGGGSLQSGHGCLALGSPEQDTAEGKDHPPAPAASAPCLGLQCCFLASNETRCHWSPPSGLARSATLPSRALLLSPCGVCFLPVLRHMSLLQWPHKPICQLPQHLRVPAIGAHQGLVHLHFA